MKYFCAEKLKIVIERFLGEEAGMTHVSLVLNVWRPLFVMVLLNVCVFIYLLPLRQTQSHPVTTSDHPHEE